MKLALIILLFIICGIISGVANASDFITSDRPTWSREDMLVRKAVQGKWYSLKSKQSKQYADIHEYIYKDKDSVTDRVNRLIEDHVQIPQKEHYAKNN